MSPSVYVLANCIAYGSQETNNNTLCREMINILAMSSFEIDTKTSRQSISIVMVY